MHKGTDSPVHSERKEKNAHIDRKEKREISLEIVDGGEYQQS
jgi:hypothetical protein